MKRDDLLHDDAAFHEGLSSLGAPPAAVPKTTAAAILASAATGTAATAAGMATWKVVVLVTAGSLLGAAGLYEEGRSPGRDLYYQEFYEGEAEDMGEVHETGLSMSTAAGDFDDCVKIRDTQFLDPDYEAFATYCSGVGFVESEEGSESELLTAYAMP